MKAYLFIETGEVRTPKTGEWYYNNTRQIFQSRQDFQFVPAPILTPHEIEIPDGATQFRYAVTCDDPMCNRGQSIPIPRPKKKVKKWRWVLRHPYIANTIFVSSASYSDDEIAKIGNAIQKIDETMVEVEE